MSAPEATSPPRRTSAWRAANWPAASARWRCRASIAIRLRFRTAEPPAAVVAELERLHVLAGRVRGLERFAPRTLDLDLLLYGDAIITEHAIRVPRDDIVKYGFVLGPLAELAPDLRHPVTGQTMSELWAAFDQRKFPLERVGDLAV
jgi:2-amino-4-hydroxy-6-hydroxymethyldihydropteridine diphosphokinase